jgi:hypothetical protein
MNAPFRIYFPLNTSILGCPKIDKVSRLVMLNLVLNSFQYWFSIPACGRQVIKLMACETMKRPMKQVQGMVQGDISRVLE